MHTLLRQRIMSVLVVSAVSAACASACWSDERSIQWTRPRSVQGPIALKAQVAYVDDALDRVVLVDISGEQPVVSHTAIGRRAIYAVPSADRHQLFVLTRGEQAIRTGEIDEPPMLWVVDAQRPSAPAVGYAIGSPFDRIAVSPAGDIAVAYYAETGAKPDGVFRNPNELAVIDLAAPPGDTNPALVTVRAFGAAPIGIALSPPIMLAGSADPTPRTFAFILAPGNITVLDATYPERSEISIRLALGGAQVIPREVVFAPGAATAYVRSDRARDVLQVALLAEPPSPGDPRSNDVRAVVSELGAGGGPTDVAVYDEASGRRVVLASTPSTREVLVIDADTAEFRTVPIADPIDRILVFSPSADGDAPPNKAVLAALGAAQPRLYVLELARLDDPLAAPVVTTITLDKPVRDVVPVPGRDLAMVVHDDARTVLGVVDLVSMATAPLLGVGKLDAYDFAPTGSHLIGATAGVPRIGLVELDNLHPSDVRLDAAPTRVLATANNKIFVDHADPFGHATIIPSPTAARRDAIVLTGFLTAGVLDEER